MSTVGGAAPAQPVDLQFVSFPSASYAAASAPTAPPAPPPAPATVAGAVAPMQFNPMLLFSPAFYKSLFNVDTVDVAARLRLALYPFVPTQFLAVVGANPDMYGPLWTCATLVFVIGASSNLASWVSFKPEGAAEGAAAAAVGAVSLWKYDFTKVTAAMFTVFGWALLAPSVLWVLLQYVGVQSAELGLVTLLCVYGYSVASFIPAALVCVLPNSGLQWAAVVASTLTSSVFVLKAVWPSIRDGAPPGQGRTLVLATFAAQLAFGFALKIYFYTNWT